MADGDDIVMDCDNGHSKACSGESFNDSDTEKESSNNTDEWKDHKAADNIAESIRNTEDTPKGVQETGDAKVGTHVPSVQNEDPRLDEEEKQFKADVQNQLTWLEETSIEMFTETSPSLNFTKVCIRLRDEREKNLQPCFHFGKYLKMKGRVVGEYLHQLKIEFEKFSKHVDSLQEISNNTGTLKDHKTADNDTENIRNTKEALIGVQETQVGKLQLEESSDNTDKLKEHKTADNVEESIGNTKETPISVQKTRESGEAQHGTHLHGLQLESTINNNVNQISRGDSSQPKTEYIENRFGTQTGVCKITYQEYICIYNSERRLGITYEYLTKDNFLGNAHRKKRFTRDDRFKGGLCPACEEYRMDDFHIGHLAASGNYKNSQNQRNDTFNLTNCVPQNTKGNKWEKIEIYTQHLLTKHKKEGALVITGWLMIERSQNGQKAIVIHRKHNTLSVPTHQFKVVITEVDNKQEGLAVFIVPNDPNEGSSFDDFSAYENLKIIEYIHGYSLAPKIEKMKLLDLSDHFKTHVLSDRQFKIHITKKKVRDARSEKKLDSALKSLGTLTPSDSLEQLYQTCKQT